MQTTQTGGQWYSDISPLVFPVEGSFRNCAIYQKEDQQPIRAIEIVVSMIRALLQKYFIRTFKLRN